MEGGKIREVGEGLKIPPEAHVIDAANSSVIPGMIDAHTHIGIGGEGLGPRFGDGNEALDPIQPHLRALDAIWHDDPAFPEVLECGVTTVFVCPGSVNVFGGVGVAIKTRPGTMDERVVPGTEGMKMALGENVKKVHTLSERYPGTRMGIAALARETLYRARDYGNKRRREEIGMDGDFRMEALQPLIEGKMKARIHAHRADDILTAIRIAEEFGLDLVIEHCTEGFLVKEILARKGIPAVAGPHLGGRAKPENSKRTLANVAALHAAGVKVALQTDAGSAVQFLPVHAAVAVREGLPPSEALRSITLTPAEIIGASDRLGSIDPGKDADLVVFPGDPLDARVKPTVVFVEGVPFRPGPRIP
jgi:imidazolonepropionase-like amidohydrolase